MGELLCGLCLTPKTLADHLVARVLRVHHLHRARAIYEPMTRGIDRSHAASAQDFFDLVAASDRDADQRVLDREQRPAAQEAPGSVVRVLQLALRTRLHGNALVILSGSFAGRKPFRWLSREPWQNGQDSSITDGCNPPLVVEPASKREREVTCRQSDDNP